MIKEKIFSRQDEMYRTFMVTEILHLMLVERFPYATILTQINQAGHQLEFKKIGSRHHVCVIIKNGREINRHLDQIRETIDRNDSLELNTSATKEKKNQRAQEHTDIWRNNPDSRDVLKK